MRNKFVRLAATFAFGMLSLGGAGIMAKPASAATLTLACGTLGISFELCKASAQDWANRTGNIVLTVPTPLDPSERRNLYFDILSDGTGKVDVFEVGLYDGVLMAPHLLDLTHYIGPADRQHFAGIYELNRVDNELKALPQHFSFGVLYYRTDLLEKYGLDVPRSWAELEAAARTIQLGERADGNRGFYGYTFGADSLLARLSVLFEWIASHGGGNVIEWDGSISINNEKTMQALEQARSLLADLVPPDVIGQTQNDARRQFQSGRVAFMRNQPFAWPLLSNRGSRVYEKVGMAPLPHGDDPHVPVTALTGSQFAVSVQSQHPQEAADLVRFLTSQPEQLHLALEAGYAPTRPVVYNDEVLQELQPFLPELYDAFTYPIILPVRTTRAKTMDVANLLDRELNNILNGELEIDAGLALIEEELTNMKGARWR